MIIRGHFMAAWRAASRCRSSCRSRRIACGSICFSTGGAMDLHRGDAARAQTIHWRSPAN
ncbi:hypothetical protein F3J17_09740 [Burkholderia sp. Ax-1719]|nr:hypothetical protein [Burkholderia sp. Ax-1719]